ncbi:hypothetical protein DJ568_14465 [Mucilaginibacter hurinus]|uniref:Uncharacterized protein n=1 Tax=Mucilaginibacter hurinus TaxID=2201324 RepID=A0A367GN14_9SPHI|nr:hypothetical protein [Mucilaginibacter hurinus]RCH54083.1 hypothetical protein DJ568_14465 [Mucilaginibacter hurinus]
MSYKFFYLFLIGGFISLGLLIYETITTYPKTETAGIFAGLVPAIVLFYLAHKVWREHNDRDLM